MQYTPQVVNSTPIGERQSDSEVRSKNMYLNRRLSNLASSLISGTFTLESRKLEGKLHQSPCRQNGELFWGVGTSKVICRFRI